MLILTRKVGQDLIIGDDVLIRVFGVSGNQVSIGIHAPANISVNRREIFEKIVAQKMTKEEIANCYPVLTLFK